MSALCNSDNCLVYHALEEHYRDQYLTLYVSLTNQVLQAIEDSLCLRTLSICLCYAYKYLLCLTVPSISIILSLITRVCPSPVLCTYVIKFNEDSIFNPKALVIKHCYALV